MTLSKEGTIAIIIAVTLSVIAITLAWSEKKAMIPSATIPHDEKWCLWRTIDAEDSIIESKPGVFEYSLIRTTKGIEVWVPCKQI